MDTFLPVRAVELLLGAGALLGLCAVAVAVRLALSPAARAARAARALLEPLGDPVLLVDAGGAVVEVNEAARRLLGGAALAGRPLSSLGADLAVLARGLARGPASGVVSLDAAGARRRARASLALVSRRPARALVVLRLEPPPRPPPLPARAAPGTPGDRAEARSALAAAADAAREPLARAAHAASLLRLASPRLEPRAAAALDALEASLEDAERRAASLAAAGHVAAARALDLAAAVEDVAATVPLPPGVRLRLRPAPRARALADDRALRAALRELLRAAAGSLAAGELWVSVRAESTWATVELAAPEGPAAPAAPLARALLAPQGARVEEERGCDGWRLRVALPAAPAEAHAPGEARASAARERVRFDAEGRGR